jgi:pectin methylesterase-like acyl-CoA thioesterase
LFNTAILFFILSSPHIFMLSVILTAPEPWWTHQRLESPETPRPTAGHTLKVSATGPADFKTVQEAAQAALPGDTILILIGIYHEVVTISSKPWLTLVGAHRDSVILEGGGRLGNGVFVVASPNVTVANMAIRNYTGNGVFFVASDHYAVVNVIPESAGEGVIVGY